MKQSHTREKMKTFVVDDSEIIQQRLIAMLSEIKHVEVVGAAQSVREAKEAIAQTQPDIVILDIRLLDGSGIDLLQYLKNNPPSPMVIMITNFPFKHYKDKSMEAGADYFLDKSTEFNKIIEIVTNAAQKFEPEKKKK